MPKFIEKILPQDFARFIDGGMDVDSFDLTEGRKRFLFDNAQAILDTTGRFRFTRTVSRTSIGPTYLQISQTGHDRLLKLLNRARREDPSFKTKTQDEVDKVKKETRRVSITSGNYFSLYSNTVVDSHKRELLINDILAQAPPYHAILDPAFIKQVLMPIFNKTVSPKDLITLLKTKFDPQRNFIKNNYRALEIASVIVLHSGGYGAHVVLVDHENITAPLKQLAKAVKEDLNSNKNNNSPPPPSAPTEGTEGQRRPKGVIFLTPAQIKKLSTFSLVEIERKVRQEHISRLGGASKTTQRQEDLIIKPEIEKRVKDSLRNVGIYLGGRSIDLEAIKAMSPDTKIASTETRQIHAEATYAFRQFHGYAEHSEPVTYSQILAGYATGRSKGREPFSHWIENKNAKHIEERIRQYKARLLILNTQMNKLMREKEKVKRELEGIHSRWDRGGLPRFSNKPSDSHVISRLFSHYMSVYQNTYPNEDQRITEAYRSAEEDSSLLNNEYNPRLLKHDRISSEINELKIEMSIIANQKIKSYEEVLAVLQGRKAGNAFLSHGVSEFVFGQGSSSQTAWGRHQGYSLDEIPISDLEHIVNELGRYTKTTTQYQLEDGDVDLIYPYESKTTSYFRNIADVQEKILIYLEGSGQSRKIASQWDTLNQEFRQEETEAEYYQRQSQLSPKPVTYANPGDRAEVERKKAEHRADARFDSDYEELKIKYQGRHNSLDFFFETNKLLNRKNARYRELEKQQQTTKRESNSSASLASRIPYEKDVEIFMASYANRWQDLNWLDELPSQKGTLVTNYGKLKNSINEIRRTMPQASNQKIFRLLNMNKQNQAWLQESMGAYTRLKVREKIRARELYDSYLGKMTPEEASNEVYKIRMEEERASKGIDTQIDSYISRVSKSQQYVEDVKEYRIARMEEHRIEKTEESKEELAYWLSGDRGGERQSIGNRPFVYVPGFDRNAAKIWISNRELPERRNEVAAIRKELRIVQSMVRSGYAYPELDNTSAGHEYYYVYDSRYISLIQMARAHVIQKLSGARTKNGQQYLSYAEMAYMGELNAGNNNASRGVMEQLINTVDMNGVAQTNIPLWQAVHEKLSWAVSGQSVEIRNKVVKGLGLAPGLPEPTPQTFGALRAAYGPDRLKMTTKDEDDKLIKYLYGSNRHQLEAMFRKARAFSIGDEVELQYETRGQSWDQRESDRGVDRKVVSMDYKIRNIIQKARKARWDSRDKDDPLGAGSRQYYDTLHDAYGLIIKFFYDKIPNVDEEGKIKDDRDIGKYRTKRYFEARGSKHDAAGTEDLRPSLSQGRLVSTDFPEGNRAFDLLPRELVGVRDYRKYMKGLNELQQRDRSVVKQLLIELDHEVQRGNMEFARDPNLLRFFEEAGRSPYLDDFVTPWADYLLEQENQQARVGRGRNVDHLRDQSQRLASAVEVRRANMPIGGLSVNRNYGMPGSKTTYEVFKEAGMNVKEQQAFPDEYNEGRQIRNPDSLGKRTTSEANVTDEEEDRSLNQEAGVYGVDPSKISQDNSGRERSYTDLVNQDEPEEDQLTEAAQVLMDLHSSHYQRPVDVVSSEMDDFDMESLYQDSLQNMTADELYESRKEGQTIIPPPVEPKIEPSPVEPPRSSGNEIKDLDNSIRQFLNRNNPE